MDSLFFLFGIGSFALYSIQTVLLARHARNLDGMTAALYANGSLIFTAFPLLFFVDWKELPAMETIMWPLVGGGVFGALKLVVGLEAQKHIPVGINSAFGRPFQIITLGIFGFLFFEETLSVSNIVFICVLLCGAAGLGTHTNDFEHLAEGQSPKGMALSALSMVLGACAILCMTVAARESDPFLIGYLWEASIGGVLVVWALIRYIFYGIKPASFTRKTLVQVAVDTSPNIVSTGLYSVAMTLGPVAILGALGSTHIIFVTLLSWGLCQEKLSRYDLLWMSILVFGILGLKII